MTRLVALTFLVKSKLSSDQLKKVHESPNTMVYPMMILAVLSLVGGWPLLSFFKVLVPLFPHHEHEGLAFGISEHQLEWGVSFLVILLAAATLYLYLKKENMLKQWSRNLTKLSAFGEKEYNVNQTLVDLGTTIVSGLSFVTSIIDINIIDRFLHSVTHTVQGASARLSKLQRGVPQAYVMYFLLGAVLLIYFIVGA